MSASDTERREVAERHGVAPLAERLRGDTAAEVEADAAKLASVVARERPEPVIRKPWSEAVFAALHGPIEPEPEELPKDHVPDFDAGARDGRPAPSDPIRAHDEWLLRAIEDEQMRGPRRW